MSICVCKVAQKVSQSSKTHGPPTEGGTSRLACYKHGPPTEGGTSRLACYKHCPPMEGKSITTANSRVGKRGSPHFLKAGPSGKEGQRIGSKPLYPAR